MKDILYKVKDAARSAAALIRKQLYKGAKKCDVCGRRVKLKAADTYIIKEPQAVFAVLSEAAQFRRAIDCPYCGNQIRYAIYVPPYEPEAGCDDED